ncbi:MAG: N-acetylmuramoyl-L-alanine amidase [Chloroflexi bacterium]|nr:N-acetylmuramoyl-L-alanine amidase [Chloroflexota bacterium]
MHIAPTRAARPAMMRWIYGVAALTLLATACASSVAGSAPPTSAEAVAQPALVAEGGSPEGESPSPPAQALPETAPSGQPAAPRVESSASAPPEPPVRPVLQGGSFPPAAPAPPEPPVAGLPAAPAAVAPVGPLAALPVADDPCQRSPGPLAPRSFRAPLPPAPVWNPPGPKRVGLQAGHWLTEQTPPELRGLQHGATGGGKQEWEVNLELAQRAARLLEAAGVEVDILPTTVPPHYRAHAFVSIHADGDLAGQLRGFKIARPAFSSIPETDDQLVAALYAAYGPATGLQRDDEHISLRMRYYYAFNSRRYCHTVAPGVPQAIVETGFLTSAADRQLLLGTPDLAARGIAEGVLAFLNGNTEP